MEVDSLLQNIDFANEEHLERVKNIVDEELRQMMSDEYSTPNIHEKLLVSAQRQLMPFVEMILDFKSLKKFADLKNAFDYITACQQENRVLPFSGLEYYITLCHNTAFVFDDINMEECEEDAIEEMNGLRHAYYEEIPQKDSDTQIIAGYYWYGIFDGYYRFLTYFGHENKDREREINRCRSLIDDILFEVLWEIDRECQHKMEDSHFKKAVTNLFVHGR